VIVATLSLAAGAVSSGTAGAGTHGSGFSSVLAGGALLVMATFVPFAILRMIPAVEAGAVAHLDGLRERGTAAMTRLPRTAASHALHEGLGALGDTRLMAQTAAAGGGGSGGVAGAGAGTGAGAAGSNDSDGDATSGISLGEGDPESPRAYEELVAQGIRPRPRGPKPILARPNPGSGGADTTADDTSAAPEAPAARPAGTSRPDVWQPAPTGPATPGDAWKWEGVPPGRSLIGKVEPGEMRYYMGDDGHGPQIRWLPAAWPPGEGPDT
jgi:hypothetical protein